MAKLKGAGQPNGVSNASRTSPCRRTPQPAPPQYWKISLKHHIFELIVSNVYRFGHSNCPSFPDWGLQCQQPVQKHATEQDEEVRPRRNNEAVGKAAGPFPERGHTLGHLFSFHPANYEGADAHCG